MRVIKTLLIFIVLFSFTFAQNKLLSMEDAILGSYKKLKVKNISQLQWMGKSTSFSYVDSLNGEYGLIIVKAQNLKQQLVLTQDSLNILLKHIGAPQVKRFPYVRWLNDHVFRFIHGQGLFRCDLQNATLQKVNVIPKGAANVQVHPTLDYVAYTKKNNLFVSLKPGQEIQVTFNPQGVKSGDAYVHRQEFGINKGIFWSPKGDQIAFYRDDQRMVTEYPLVDIDSRPAKVRMIRYPFTGMTSEQVSVGIYHIKTGSITYLQTGEPKDHYKCSVTWSPDEKYIYLVELNRDQDHLWVNQYAPYDGRKIATLFEEKNPKWVEPEHGLFFVNDDPNRFVWFSKRDGFNDLFLFNSHGKLLRKLTRSQRDVTAFLGFDSQGKYAFFMAATDRGLGRQLFKVRLKSGSPHKLTSGKGVHRVLVQKEGRYFLDRFTNLQTPNRIALLDAKGKQLKVLLDAPNPLRDYKLGKIKLLTVKDKEGIALNARMILPPDFDAHKKYPVIVYVYGGPHGQMITNSWLRGWPLWYQYMAERGYIIFTLDNRGTNNRGLAFEQAIYQHLGTKEVEDQMAGVNYLKHQPFVDSTRIGVHGWSYGGFMTISLMTRRPGVFKVAVAGGPVIDWRYYEVMYGERYMDTPQKNPQGYKESSLLNYVQNLKGKLLIIHGTVDPVVVWQNSLLYLRKAIDLGKQLDYFVYPGDEHNMRGKDRVHLYQKITDYFMDHL